MKLTTDKKYILYYDYLTKFYDYNIISNVDKSIKFWSKKVHIMYSGSLKIIELTTNKLNEDIYY